MPSSSHRSPRAGRKVADSLKASSAIEPGQIPSDIGELDALFATAGLRRSRREKPAGVGRRARFQDKSPEELRPAAPDTVMAANGAEWIPAPAWRKLKWLWHGFSTRRGGASTCYAPEDAPGELNLTFTPDDARENVERNRRLFVEAITGSGETPLVTLRQIHSSVLVFAGPGLRSIGARATA